MDGLSSRSESIAADWELQSQRWYWGKATKEEIAQAIQGHPTGTFCVRDASTLGDYTLTVRVGESNKLVKILARNGRVGFTLDTLDFASVVDLVDYYRHTSLEEHNAALRTALKFPLLRSLPAEPPLPKEEDEDGLLPERVPRKLGNARRDGVKIDNEHRATAFVLHHFLEGLIAEMQRTERRHNLILSQIEALEQEHAHHEKAMRGLDSVEHLLQANRKTLKQNLLPVSDEKLKETVATNITLQDKRLVRVAEIKKKLVDSLEGIARIKSGLNREDVVMTKRVKVIKERCDRYTKELLSFGVDGAFIERITDCVSLAIQLESEKLLQNLLKVNLATSPFDWLTANPDKRYSAGLIEQSLKLLKKRNVANTNGVFLMRPSSKPGCFALGITMNERIFNCLVEYREPKGRDDTCGYAFLNTNLFYSTLADFVRYYSLVTLREHNEQLDTVLRIPVLRYLATVRRRRKTNAAQMDAIDKEEAELISELDMDSADQCHFDETDSELEDAFSSEN